MKRVAMFCIPAHGHINPMLPVARALAARGNDVRFYAFREFEERIRATGATFVPCDAYLGELTEKEAAGLKRVSTTEMTVQDIRVTRAMNDFLAAEFETFRPDVVYTDSVCFWGKLNAWKFDVPMVVSTSTFAFNQLSSRYMKHSAAEMADMIFGLPRVARELKTLRPLGYPAKGPLALVQSDDATDSVVYTSRRFQPYAESFSDHYRFVGPSIAGAPAIDKAKARPLVYVSMGTVINDRPDFYKNCVAAARDMDVDMVIACGQTLDQRALGELPGNVRVYPRVDQLEVLSRADAFITHCGMNSVSESLYMATPMLLYPQTGEQQAVARRAAEIGAGVWLRDDTPDGIRAALKAVLADPDRAHAAADCAADFRACEGPEGAAAFIESAPHAAEPSPVLRAINRMNGRFQLCWWLVAALVALVGLLLGWKRAWIAGLVAGSLAQHVAKPMLDRWYRRAVERLRR